MAQPRWRMRGGIASLAEGKGKSLSRFSPNTVQSPNRASARTLHPSASKLEVGEAKASPNQTRRDAREAEGAPLLRTLASNSYGNRTSQISGLQRCLRALMLLCAID
jgi:hypothetical protein